MSVRTLELCPVALPKKFLAYANSSSKPAALPSLGQHLSISQRRPNEHAAVLAIPQRTDGNGDLLARFQRRLAPAAASQVVGTHALDGPTVHAALLVRHVHPNPGMGIGPLEPA